MKNKKSLLGICLIGMALALFGVILTKSDVTIAAECNECCTLICNQNYYSSGSKCVKCDTGYTAPLQGPGGRDRCTRTCTGANHVATTGGNCVLCPIGKASYHHIVSGGNVSFCVGCSNKPSIGAYYTAPGSGDKYSCQWDCETGFEKSANGDSCVCPANYYYDSASKSCKPCQNGYTSAPGLGGVNSCQKQCDGGTHVESPRGSCVDCGVGSGRSYHIQSAPGTSICSGCVNGPTNKNQYPLNVGYYYITNGTSINSCTWECSSGYYLSGTYPNGKCIPCNPGYYTPDGSGAKSVEKCVTHCPLNYHVATGGHACVKCPINAQTTPAHNVPQGMKTDCGVIICPEDTYKSGDNCEPCPGGRTSLAGSTSVNDCKIDCGECGYVEEGRGVCKSCPMGKLTRDPVVTGGNTSQCNNICQNKPITGSEYVSGPACCSWQCSAGFYLNLAKNGCTKCPYGSSEAGSDSVNDCSIDSCGVPPSNGHFTGNCVKECNAGYYLNSAGTGCTKCPYGSSMTGSDSVNDCKEAQCGPAQGPSYVNEPELLCNNIANSTGVTAGTDTYSWQCTYVNHTVSCSTHRIYSCGTVPTGAGVKTGAKTREYGYTPGTWTYTGSDTPGACEWTCKSGYEKSGNTCVAKSAQCGPAQTASYTSIPNTALLCNFGSSTGAREDPSGCSYRWNCSNLENSVSCSTTRKYSCGTAPTGAGVVTGESSRICSDTIHTWTYTNSTTLGACQWRCEDGYKSGTNTCIVKTPQCGTSNGGEFTAAPTDGLCGDVGTLSGTVSWTTTGFNWICKNLTKSVACSATRLYINNCGGYTPSGAGLVTGGNTYLSGHTTTVWTYKTTGNLSSCEWRCQPGYISGTNNTCVAIQPKCGSASGANYSSKPSSLLCGAGTASSVSSSNTGYTWTCSNLGTSVNCSAGRYYTPCDGITPSGDGVEIGLNSYYYGGTSSWTYRATGILSGCEWRCRGGYERAGNTCVAAGYSDLEMYFVTNTGATGYYAMMDRNLGATAYMNEPGKTASEWYGSYYQWGNNYGFPNQGSVNTSTTQVDASSYGPGTPLGYYSSDTFIIGSNDWSNQVNYNLWGGNLSEAERKGPCPSGYHVPGATEFKNLLDVYWSHSINNYSLATASTQRSLDSLMPLAGARDYSSANVESQGNDGYYWYSSTRCGPFRYACDLRIHGGGYLEIKGQSRRAYGYSVRCSKNSTIPSKTINPNGGTGALIVVHDGVITKLGTPHKGTDVFGGWYKYSTFAPSTQVQEGDTIANGTNLYAKWIKAECGAASGQAYQNLTSSSSDLCGTGTVGNFNSGTNFTWNCTTGTSTVSCSAAKEQNCTGTPPQGDHVLMGASTYVSPHTPTSWTYTTNSSLTGCQWSCETGYVDKGNKCVTPQEKECGPYDPNDFQDLDMYFLPNTNEGDVSHYTLMDKNLGATEVYDGTNNVCTYGYYYQWGNNYGFSNTGEIKTSTTRVNTIGYGPGNYYSSGTFVKVHYANWSANDNRDLWGDEIDASGNNPSARQGPCPNYYHVPSYDELRDIFYNKWRKSVSDTSSSMRKLDSLMPSVGYRYNSNSNVYSYGSAGIYWSSSPYENDMGAYALDMNSTAQFFNGRGYGYPVRCFKNTPNSILTVHKNGGTGAVIIVHGNEITKLGSPTRSGADFEGWYTDSLFVSTSKVITGNTVSNGTHLYAKWNLTQCPVGYYIAGDSCVQCQPGYYCPDGQNRSGCVVGDYNSEWGAASCTLCPTGYTTTGTKSTSVTQCHKRLSVQYYKNGSTSIGKTSDTCNAFCSTATNCDTSCSVIAPNITRAGFDILGWNTNQNAYNGISVGGTITLNGAHNSTTQYYAITKKDVNGMFLKGEGVHSVDPEEDSCTIWNSAVRCNISPMADAICTGGYYGPQWDEQDLNGVSSDVTTTASCTKCPNGTTSAVGSVTVDQCVSTQCPAGKYKSNNNSCVDCPNGTTSNLGAADVTQCYKTFTATFNKNGATSICSNAESCDAHCADATCNSLSCSVSMSANCIDRDGFEILGWSTDSNATSATNQITLTANATYYAITKKDVTLRFIKGLGVSSLTMTGKSCTIWNTDMHNGTPACLIGLPLATATCDAGYYNPDWGVYNMQHATYLTMDVDAVANCTACPSGAGYYYTSPEGSTVKSQCYIVCPPNTYVAETYGPCLPCTGDTIRESHVVSGGSVLLRGCYEPTCETGRYFNSSNNLCTECPGGRTTSGNGATSVRQCYQKFTATFIKNGATSISTGSESCNAYCTTATSCETSCVVANAHGITRPYWTPLGWSTDPNAEVAMYTVNDDITLTSDMTFYAITKQECPAGKYSIAGANQCQLCPAGKYNSGTLIAYNTKTTSCSNVKCGCYGASQGATTDCPSSCSGIGQYSLAGATSCNSCGNGPEGGDFFYTSNGGCSNSCEWKCKEGLYYNSSTKKCESCPDGYTSEAGAKQIESCFVDCNCGSVVKTKFGKCESCGGSLWAVTGHRVYRGRVSSDGGYSCKKCTNGPTEGTSEYVGNNCKNDACNWVCGKNFYKISTNICKPCSSNYYTDSSGASDISACKIDCPAGTHVAVSAGQCVPCDDGYAIGNHLVSEGSKSNCSPCNSQNLPSNASWAGAGTGINNCPWHCNAGYYLSGGKCRSCVTDYGAGYFSNTGKNYCFELPRCGSSSGQEFTSMPSKYLCSVGTDNNMVVGHGAWNGLNWYCPAGRCDMNRIAGWSWDCYRIMDGVTYTVSCMAPKKTSCDADCGSAEDGESLKCYKSSSVTCSNTCDGSRLQGYNSKTLTCIDGERKKGVSVTQTNGTVTTSYTNDSFGDYIYSSCQTQNQTLPYTWSSCPAAYVGCSNVSISVSNNNGGCSSATWQQWNGVGCASNYFVYTNSNGVKSCEKKAACGSNVFNKTYNHASPPAVGYLCDQGVPYTNTIANGGVLITKSSNIPWNANHFYWTCNNLGNEKGCYTQFNGH